MTWHCFQPSTDDDSECVLLGCGLVIGDVDVNDWQEDCPAPSCSDPSNREHACVIVRTETGLVCAYCERQQAKDQTDDNDDDETDLTLSNA